MFNTLSLDDTLAIHNDLIHRYGGSTPLRDRGALESALLRPSTGYYEDEIEAAAALWESLAQNHPFIDGNKRTAFAVTYIFLAINGYEWVASQQGTGDFIYSLYAKNIFTFDHILPWLRKNLRLMQAEKKIRTIQDYYLKSCKEFSLLYRRLAQ